LRSGQGNHLSVAALESLDDVSKRGRSPIRQQSLRARSQAGGPAPEECVVLPDAARSRGGRPVYDADPHLPVCGANSFDYLTELQRHVRELTANPAEWMPWNYRQKLEPP